MVDRPHNSEPCYFIYLFYCLILDLFFIVFYFIINFFFVLLSLGFFFCLIKVELELATMKILETPLLERIEALSLL